VVHWFAPQAVDSDLGHHFMEELKPLGLLGDPQSFGDVFGAVVNSVCPHDPQRAWHLFGTNTLHRFQQLLTTECRSPHNASPVDVFASLYRHVYSLLVGDSFLDVACSLRTQRVNVLVHPPPQAKTPSTPKTPFPRRTPSVGPFTGQEDAAIDIQSTTRL
jgi:hypothetical protein